MNTKLQAWGNSQGIRLPKPLLAELGLKQGAAVEIELTPKKDAILVKPARTTSRIRDRRRLEDLVAALPKGYRTTEFGWGRKGREVW